MQKGAYGVQIPSVLHQVRVEDHTVLFYLVQVSEDVQSSVGQHLGAVVVEGACHVLDVIAEVRVHVAHKALGTAVYIDVQAAVVFGRDEVYRAYDVVQSQVAEIPGRGAPLCAEVVHFHRAVDVHLRPTPLCRLHFGKICRDIFSLHIAGRVDRHGRMGAVSVMVHFGLGCRLGKGCNVGMSVAELGVRVEVVSGVCAYDGSKVFHQS